MGKASVNGLKLVLDAGYWILDAGPACAAAPAGRCVSIGSWELGFDCYSMLSLSVARQAESKHATAAATDAATATAAATATRPPSLVPRL